MGVMHSIFFKPARGYKKYIYDENGNPGKAESDLYQLDGVLNEQHNSRVKLTKHPVEHGVDLTDHAIKQPMKVVVNGIVTNTPRAIQLANRLPGSAESVLDGLGSNIVDVIKSDRARKAYKGLVELQNARLPVRLQTGLLQYDNMVLTDISAPNDIQSNLRVRLTFEEIFVVKGDGTGVTQATTINPSEIDYLTASTTLAGLGLTELLKLS